MSILLQAYLREQPIYRRELHEEGETLYIQRFSHFVSEWHIRFGLLVAGLYSNLFLEPKFVK